MTIVGIVSVSPGPGRRKRRRRGKEDEKQVETQRDADDGELARDVVEEKQAEATWNWRRNSSFEGSTSRLHWRGSLVNQVNDDSVLTIVLLTDNRVQD